MSERGNPMTDVERAKDVLDSLGSSMSLEDTERYATWLRNGGPRQLLREVWRLQAEVNDLNAEIALLRDGYNVRPMTEVESNLMTQILDLRRKLRAQK